MRVAAPVGLLLLVAAALVGWKAQDTWLAAGQPASGESLTGPHQLVPYALFLAFRSLAVGLGSGAVAALLAAVVAWRLRRDLPELSLTAPSLPRWPVWRITALAALVGLAYGVAWRATSDLRTVGDESSYLERGRVLTALLRQGNLHGLYDWFQGTAHRPWPGLLPTYLGSLVGLSEPWLVGLQAAAAWSLLTWAMLRLGRTLALRPSAVAVALALLLTQPLWRAETTAILADTLLTGAALLALAETVAFLQQPDGRACVRLAAALALVPAMKPGGIIWAVVPLTLAAAVWLLAVERRAPWRWRLVRLMDLAALVGVAVPIGLLLAGGPKVWAMVARHGVSVESLGYYDEAVATLAERSLWLLGVLPRLVTVPLLILAFWGALRGRGPGRLAALAVLLVPLLIHAFAMESKSLRLVGAALAGLGGLALLGAQDLARTAPVARSQGAGRGTAGELGPAGARSAPGGAGPTSGGIHGALGPRGLAARATHGIRGQPARGLRDALGTFDGAAGGDRGARV